MWLDQFAYLIMAILGVVTLMLIVGCTCGIGYIIGNLCGYEDSTIKQNFTWGALAISYMLIAVNIYQWYVGFV